MNQQLINLRIVWGALTSSLFLYGFILFTRGAKAIYLPSSYSALEMVSLSFGALLLATVFIHEKLIRPETEFQKKFVKYVICWALHESILLMGFVASFIAETDNIFFYAVNLSLALTGNLLMFPKEAQAKH